MTDSSRPWSEPATGAGRPALAPRASALAPAARRALGFAGVALAGSWLGFYLITQLPYIDRETFRATLVLHLVTGLVFLPYLASLVVGRRLPGGSVLDAPLIALLAVYLLTTATSLNWRLSLEVSLTVLMALGIFYVLSDGRLLRRWQVETALMLAVLAAALRALWVVGGDYLEWLRLSDAVRGGLSFGDLVPPTVPKVHDVGDHPNLLGGILAMSLPFFLVAVFRPLPAAWRAGAALGAAALLLAVFFSLARSAWLGAAAGAFLTLALVALAPAGGRRRLWPREPVRQRLVAGAALAALVVMAGGVLVAARSVEARPLWLFRPSGEPRVDAMGAGAEMIADYPLLGTGPGVYGLLYPEYSGKNPNHAFHSHNGFLQTAVDAGLLGVAAMLAAAGALGWLCLRGLRETEGDARLSLIACAGGLTAFATFSLLDAPNGFKGPLVALAALAAVAALSARERPQRPSHTAEERWARPARAAQLAARAAVPVALAGLLIVWGRLDVAHFHYSNGLASARAQLWPAAIERAQRAVNLDPQFAPYRLQLGAVQGQAYLATGDPALLDRAVAQLERAVELEPRSAIGHVNLALLVSEAGRRERARVEALTAIEVANSDPAVVVAAGTALEMSNWGDDAVEAYSLALFLDAGLADSPFWSSSPFRAERFPDILGRSALVFNHCLLLSLTKAGLPAASLDRDAELALCREQVIASPGDSAAKVTLAEALIEDGDVDGARALLDGVLGREPDYGPGRTALGRWYAARGELEEAREQWLRAGQLEEVDALVLLGDSYPPGQVPPEVVQTLRAELDRVASQVQFHLIGILYYRFKFQRASPAAIIVPGDWLDAVPGRYARARDALDRWTGQE